MTYTQNTPIQFAVRLSRACQFESLSINAIASMITDCDPDKNYVAWRLFVDCYNGRLNHTLHSEYRKIPNEYFGDINSKDELKWPSSSSFKYFHEFNIGRFYLISKSAFHAWIKQTEFWGVVKDCDFIKTWLTDELSDAVPVLSIQSDRFELADPCANEDKETSCSVDKKAMPMIQVELESFEQPITIDDGGAQHNDSRQAIDNHPEVKILENQPAANPDSTITPQKGIGQVVPIIAHQPVTLKNNCMQNNNKYWSLTFNQKTKNVKNTQGMHYIDYLIRNKNRRVHVLELVSMVNQSLSDRLNYELEHELADEPLVKLLDDHEISDLKRHIRVLTKSIEIETLAGSELNVSKIKAERDQLKLFLKKRSHLPLSVVARCAKSVEKRIHSDIRSIRGDHPELADHLMSRIKAGVRCSYRAISGVNWE